MILLALMIATSASANEVSSCLSDAMDKAPERVKTLAAEVMTIKAEFTLIDSIPFFTVLGKHSEEERVQMIADNYFVTGDMLWPLDVHIDKETAQANGLGDEEINEYSGAFLAIRCKSATSREVESMWFHYDKEKKEEVEKAL